MEEILTQGQSRVPTLSLVIEETPSNGSDLHEKLLRHMPADALRQFLDLLLPGHSDSNPCNG